MTVDRYVKGTKEFDNLENELFNNYFPTFTMELEENYHDTEIYKINLNHKVTCNYCNGKLYEIIVEKYYYYYNK